MNRYRFWSVFFFRFNYSTSSATMDRTTWNFIQCKWLFRWCSGIDLVACNQVLFLCLNFLKFKKKSQLTQNPTTTAMTMKPFDTRPFQDYDAVFTKIATISHYDHMCEARSSAKRTFGYKQRVQLTIYSAFRLCGGGGIDGLSIVVWLDWLLAGWRFGSWRFVWLISIKQIKNSPSAKLVGCWCLSNGRTTANWDCSFSDHNFLCRH